MTSLQPSFISHRSYLIAIVVKQSVPKILDFHHGCQVFQNETCAIAEQLFCLTQLKSYSKKSHQTIGNISLIEKIKISSRDPSVREAQRSYLPHVYGNFFEMLFFLQYRVFERGCDFFRDSIKNCPTFQVSNTGGVG